MEIERTLGINHVNISYACKHSTTAGGFVWKYKEEEIVSTHGNMKESSLAK